MRKIKFINDAIQKKYDEYADTFLTAIIYLSIENDDEAMITNVYYQDKFLYIIMQSSIATIKVLFDYSTFDTVVTNDYLPYKVVYSNTSRKLLVPDRYVYQSKNSKLIKRHVIEEDEEIKEYKYDYDKNNQLFFINIRGDFDEEKLINNLLTYQDNINNINEMINIIKRIIPLDNIEILIKKDCDLIHIKKNHFIDYHYHIESMDNNDKEIYYQNNTFYIKETKIQELKNNSYIKKLGGYDGKKES